MVAVIGRHGEEALLISLEDAPPGEDHGFVVYPAKFRAGPVVGVSSILARDPDWEWVDPPDHAAAQELLAVLPHPPVAPAAEKAVTRYSPDQPREPAGSPEGGQFAGDVGGAGGSAADHPQGPTIPEAGTANVAVSQQVTSEDWNEDPREYEAERLDRLRWMFAESGLENPDRAETVSQNVKDMWHHDHLAQLTSDFRAAAAAEFGLPGAKETVEQFHSEYWTELKATARGIYDETQRQLLNNHGDLSHLTLFRGMQVPDAAVPTSLRGSDVHANATLQLKPLDSWTTDPAVAHRFATGTDVSTGIRPGHTGVVLQARFPIQRILGWDKTGIGFGGEAEVVVLGGPAHVRVHRTTSGGTVDVTKAAPLDLGEFGWERHNDNWLCTNTALQRALPGFVRAWDEEQHPREPAGTSAGGEFASGAGGSYEGYPDGPRDSFLPINTIATAMESADPSLSPGDAVQAAQDVMRRWNANPKDPASMLLMLQAAEVFGLTDAEPTPHKLPIPEIADLLIAPVTAAGLKAVLKPMYDATQAHLAKRGIAGGTLYRGMILPSATVRAMEAAGGTLRQRALSSWTSDASVAREYADPKYHHNTDPDMVPVIVSAHVPASRVLSSPQTGFGYDMSAEIVVLGGPIPVHVHRVTPAKTAASDGAAARPVIVEDDRAAEWLHAMRDRPPVRSFTREWDESQHPRVPAGSPEGGEFGGGEGSPQAAAVPYQGPEPPYSERTDPILWNPDGGEPLYAGDMRSWGEANYERLADELQKDPTMPFDPPGGKETARGMFRSYATGWNGGGAGHAELMAVATEFGLSTADVYPDPFHQTFDPATKPWDRARMAWARATYDATQADFKAQGLKEVTLYRGTAMMPDKLPPGVHESRAPANADVQMQPLSSWTSNPQEARRFAIKSRGGDPTPVVLAARFPVSRIFSTVRTGPGTFPEREYVVLRGKTTARLHVDVEHLDRAITGGPLPVVTVDATREDMNWLHWLYGRPAPVPPFEPDRPNGTMDGGGAR
jgi:hypothetical protein